MLNHDDTDDILQEVFIKVFRKAKTFKGESKLYTWLYRIATNESLTFLKRRARLLKVSDGELRERTLSNLRSDPYFDGDAAHLRLQKAISKLPRKQRLVFNMRYFDELKYREMAEILETSKGALKASYHHAVKKIKHQLDLD